MKILICSHDIPWPVTDGRRIRTFNLARELAGRHEVHLFCLGGEPADADQLQACADAGLKLIVALKPPLSLPARVLAYGRRLADGVPPGYILSWERSIAGELRVLAARERFDVAIAEHLFMARHIASLQCPKVLVEHNVEARLQAAIAQTASGIRRPLRQAGARWTGRYERRMLRRMQGVIAVSEEDAVLLRRQVPAGIPVAVVDNGVRCDQFSDLAGEKISDSRMTSLQMLFIGLMSYPPNIEAADWFAVEVMPLVLRRAPEAGFNIVGGGAPPRVLALGDRNGVRVHGYVTDVRSHYRQNSLMVAPLLTGGGSRLKLLEAFAAGMPVVSTSKGAEGLRVKDGRHLLLADTAADFAAAILRLHGDHDLYLELSHNARSLAEESYDWSVLGLRLDVALTDMTGKALH
ncbi:MAG: glycosyltransferase family 4 protein [Thermoleophilia bacterium]